MIESQRKMKTEDILTKMKGNQAEKGPFNCLFIYSFYSSVRFNRLGQEMKTVAIKQKIVDKHSS